jgi:ubiquitin carboxyl-terminal hydrolase 14
VTVSWGSQKYDLEVDPSSRISALMDELLKLTHVPLERQKLMLRRKSLTPTDPWDPADLKPGLRIMLFGTAEDTSTIEIGPASESDDEVIDSPLTDPTLLIGLRNYGNTCYFNAVLQVLRHLPDFVKLMSDADIEGRVFDHRFAKALVSFFHHFPANLVQLLSGLRSYVPAFKNLDMEGQYMQQDAAECWTQVIDCVRKHIISDAARLFDIHFSVTSDTLDPFEEVDDRLRCPITGDADSSHITNAIDLNGEVEMKRGDETVIASVHRAISALPRYLAIQMMRFCFRRDEGAPAKITKKVEFPARLDVLKWVSLDLRRTIVEKREGGESDAGYFRLKAIITHRGRSCSSGHYVAHVNVDGTWFRYDDEKVTEITDEDIDLLAGDRADWHCSYILIYERL